MMKDAPTDYPIHDLIRARWSPLAFADRPIPAETLRSLFEAVRWSPSSFNAQPWRFIVGTKDGDDTAYAKIFNCLMPFNQAWAQTAPLLMLTVAVRDFEHNGQPNRWAAYDTGQAVGALTIQATHLGLHLHQMAGFDVESARGAFGIGEKFEPLTAIAIGYMGDASVFEDEKLIERHNNPVRARKPLAEFVFSGASGTFGEASALVS